VLAVDIPAMSVAASCCSGVALGAVCASPLSTRSIKMSNPRTEEAPSKAAAAAERSLGRCG
jgi:hypothetical protein